MENGSICSIIKVSFEVNDSMTKEEKKALLRAWREKQKRYTDSIFFASDDFRRYMRFHTWTS